MFLGRNLLERERKETRSRLKTALFFPVFFRSKSFLNGRFFRFFPFLRLVSRFFPFFSSFCLFLAISKPFTPFKPRPQGPKFGICERVLNATRSKPVQRRSRNHSTPFTKSFKAFQQPVPLVIRKKTGAWTAIVLKRFILASVYKVSWWSIVAIYYC